MFLNLEIRNKCTHFGEYVNMTGISFVLILFWDIIEIFNAFQKAYK